jgi:hypothetical protein
MKGKCNIKKRRLYYYAKCKINYLSSVSDHTFVMGGEYLPFPEQSYGGKFVVYFKFSRQADKDYWYERYKTKKEGHHD